LEVLDLKKKLVLEREAMEKKKLELKTEIDSLKLEVLDLKTKLASEREPIETVDSDGETEPEKNDVKQIEKEPKSATESERAHAELLRKERAIYNNRIARTS
jgi:hypothetical protein